MADQHFFEISKSNSPAFTTTRSGTSADDQMSEFEVSLLMGAMVHPASTFSVELSTSSVTIEWFQEYAV